MSPWNRSAVWCSLLSAAVMSPVQAWAGPLPCDSRLVVGRLDNGVTWMYRRHDNPPGRICMMMHVRTGSLNETDRQRGLSHFLEHMAFNGTEHFPPGTLIPYFESIGMTFGSDLNAATGFDRTGYSLYLPGTDAAQIDKALMVLSDYAFRMTLSEKEIDEERGVILEEARARKSASQRIRDRLWPELFSGSRFAARLPIGDEGIIAGAPRDEFVRYYRTWYRPENITLIVVGDADPGPIIPLIGKWFGQYRADVPPGTPMGPEFKPFTQEMSIVVADPELTTCSVQVCHLLPGRPPAVTVEQYRVEMVEDVAARILTRRLNDRVRQGQAAYRSAEAGVADFYRDAILVSAAASGEPADWPAMLEELIVEIRRACEYGFTPRELDLVKKEIMAAAERSVRTESTISARSLIQSIFTSVDRREPVLSARQQLDLIGELLPAVTIDEITRTFRDRFDRKTCACVVTTPEGAGRHVPSRDEVMAATRAARARRIEPPPQEIAAAGLPAPPAPGRIVESTVDAEFGVTSAWLENNIRVHHRFMDYKKDQVLVNINLAGGGIEETDENLGVSLVASLVLAEPATGGLSSTSIRDLRLGRNIKLGGGAEDDETFGVRIAGSPEDLEFGLQLAWALLTDGRIEEAAFRNWRIATLRALEKSGKDVAARAGDALGDLTGGGDPRRMSIRKSHIEKLSIEQGQEWFNRLCRTAPVEVAVVGDIPWDRVKPLIERYLGSLPPRNRSAAHLDGLRVLGRKQGPLERRVEVDTVTPAGVACAGFIGCEGKNVPDRRALQVAEKILSTRLVKHIREELALVYSIDASHQAAWIYRDSGTFRAGSKCKPENARRVAAEVHRLFGEFAEKGPSPEELENARKQLLNSLDAGMREPQYWMSLLEHMDLRGRSLDEARTHRQHYESITAGEVQAAFRKYYVPARMFTVTAVPATAASGPASGPVDDAGDDAARAAAR